MGKTIQIDPKQRATRMPNYAPPKPPSPSLEDNLVDPLSTTSPSVTSPPEQNATEGNGPMGPEEVKFWMKASRDHLSRVFRYTENLMSSPTLQSVKQGATSQLAKGLDDFAELAKGSAIEAPAQRITQVARRIQSITDFVPAPPEMVKAATVAGKSDWNAKEAWDQAGNARGIKKLTKGIGARLKQRKADRTAKNLDKVRASYDQQLLAAVPELSDLDQDWKTVDGFVPGPQIIEASLESLRTNVAQALADPQIKKIEDENFYVPPEIRENMSEALRLELLTTPEAQKRTQNPN